MTHLVLPLCLLLVTTYAGAQSAARSRGELLYSTHCIECHTQNMHWRAGRLGRDWNTLRAQVVRWQKQARLDWKDDDVDAVTAYLNESIYHFPHGQATASAAAARR